MAFFVLLRNAILFPLKNFVVHNWMKGTSFTIPFSYNGLWASKLHVIEKIIPLKIIHWNWYKCDDILYRLRRMISISKYYNIDCLFENTFRNIEYTRQRIIIRFLLMNKIQIINSKCCIIILETILQLATLNVTLKVPYFDST